MFDAYGLRARLAPVGLAALPALALLGGGLASPTRATSVVAMAFGGVGLVAAGAARDAGRALQASLWRAWGGSPTVRRLRWQSASEPDRQARRHLAMSQAAGFSLPTKEEEAENPALADSRYDEATALLRSLTRDRNRFPLIFAENVEYGFRRNCLGLRPVGLTIAIAAAAVGSTLIVAGDSRYFVGIAVSLLAALWWYRAVTPEWVRKAAELYADELMNGADVLRVERQAGGSDANSTANAARTGA